jgi:hypothetical protein
MKRRSLQSGNGRACEPRFVKPTAAYDYALVRLPILFKALINVGGESA